MASEIIVAFDFECAGGVPQYHGFTQLGASAHDSKTGEKIAGFNQYSNMEGFSWEDRCVREFWEKNPDLYKHTLEKVSQSTLSCSQVVANFIAWLRSVVGDKPCFLISDNIMYDGALIRFFSGVDCVYLLGRWTDFVSIPSVYQGLYASKFKSRIDTSLLDMKSKKLALAALKKDGEVSWPEFNVSHDHNPENDAELMARQFIFVMNTLENSSE